MRGGGKANGAIALTLHGVVPDGPAGAAALDPAAARYAVPGSLLRSIAAQVASITHCTASEVLNRRDGICAVLTFDDGLVSDYSEVFPVLAESGVRATFFLSTANIGRTGYMTLGQINEMAAAGMEMASHGVEHRYLVSLSPEQARLEMLRSHEELRQLLGREVFSFAPVGGHYRPWMIDYAAEIGYRVFATMVPGRTVASGQDVLVLKRNHLQARHNAAYAASLLAGDRFLLAKNRARYGLLYLTKRLLGMEGYDRVRSLLLGGGA